MVSAGVDEPQNPGLADVPVGCDPMLWLFCLAGGTFPVQVLVRQGAGEDRWETDVAVWAGAAGYGIGPCPVQAFVREGRMTIATSEGSWTSWRTVPLPIAGDLAPVSNPPGTLSTLDTGTRDGELSTGSIGERAVHQALLAVAQDGFDRATVQTTAHRAKSADFNVATRAGTILVEAKNYARPVPFKEVHKLERDLEVSGASGALLVALGSGVAGQSGTTALRMVPSREGGLRPLVVVCIETGLEAACRVGLAAAMLLAAEHPRGNLRLSQLDDHVAGLTLRLENADTLLGQAVDRAKEVASAAIATHMEGQSALVGAKTALATVTAFVRQSQKSTRVGVAASWPQFLELFGGAVADSALVHTVWAAVSARAPEAEWETERKTSGGGAAHTTFAGVKVSLRFLAASSHFAFAVDDALAVPGLLQTYLADPQRQKLVRISAGRVDIKIAEGTHQLLGDLIRDIRG